MFMWGYTGQPFSATQLLVVHDAGSGLGYGSARGLGASGEAVVRQRPQSAGSNLGERGGHAAGVTRSGERPMSALGRMQV
jgi:hypothetical protein